MDVLRGEDKVSKTYMASSAFFGWECWTPAKNASKHLASWVATSTHATNTTVTASEPRKKSSLLRVT